MGGALAAVAPDFTRAALGVPAMSYSILLPRSVDYDEFALLAQRRLHRRALAAAAALADPDALGPRRARTATPHRMTTNPLPGHAAAHDPDGRRGRRPPGDQLDVGRRGADDRRPGARPGRRPGPLARHRRALERAADRVAIRSRARRHLHATSGRCGPTRTTRRRRSARRRRRFATCPTASARTRTAPRAESRTGSPRSPTSCRRRRRAQPLRRQALLRRRLDRALSLPPSVETGPPRVSPSVQRRIAPPSRRLVA